MLILDAAGSSVRILKFILTIGKIECMKRKEDKIGHSCLKGKNVTLCLFRGDFKDTF